MRVCPLCLTKVAPGPVAAYSNDLTCPGCGARLQISPVGRNLAIAAGLAAGAAVWRWTGDAGELGWALPIVTGYLAFSAVSAILLMLLADLQVKAASETAAPATADASGGHGGGHH
jgi:hypothetical protein